MEKTIEELTEEYRDVKRTANEATDALKMYEDDLPRLKVLRDAVSVANASLYTARLALLEAIEAAS